VSSGFLERTLKEVQFVSKGCYSENIHVSSLL
jgi:hypothetical protein